MCIASILFDFFLMAFVDTTTGIAKKQLGLFGEVFFGAELLQDQAEVSLAVDSILVNTREPALYHKHSSLQESVTQLSRARR